MQTIWLFDIDGVLVHSAGYRAALKASVTHLAEAMGLREVAPDDETAALFDACGLPSEWDTTAMCAAVLLLEAAQAAPELQFDPDFWQSAARVRASGLQALEPRHAEGIRGLYQALALRVAETRQPGELAGQAMLRVLTGEWLAKANLDGRGPALAQTMRHLLADTRDFPRAPGIFIFQHYALGSQVFSETYGMVPEFETAGLLRENDRPALSPGGLRQVQTLLKSGLRAAAMTARPSLAPRDFVPPLPGYSPEAELALSQVGLSDLPLMGWGRLVWLAGEAGQQPEKYLKPGPVHALAGIGAALGNSEATALRAAARLLEQGEAGAEWQALAGERLALHVFEDSPGGIRSVQTAAEYLERAGISTAVHAWGVAADAEKSAALRRLGAQVLPDVNAAIEKAQTLMEQ